MKSSVGVLIKDFGTVVNAGKMPLSIVKVEKVYKEIKITHYKINTKEHVKGAVKSVNFIQKETPSFFVFFTLLLLIYLLLASCFFCLFFPLDDDLPFFDLVISCGFYLLGPLYDDEDPAKENLTLASIEEHFRIF